MCSSQLTFLLQAMNKIGHYYAVEYCHTCIACITVYGLVVLVTVILLLATMQILYSPRSPSMCGTERWTPVLLHPVHP